MPTLVFLLKGNALMSVTKLVSLCSNYLAMASGTMDHKSLMNRDLYDTHVYITLQNWSKQIPTETLGIP